MFTQNHSDSCLPLLTFWPSTWKIKSLMFAIWLLLDTNSANTNKWIITALISVSWHNNTFFTVWEPWQTWEKILAFSPKSDLSHLSTHTILIPCPSKPYMHGTGPSQTSSDPAFLYKQAHRVGKPLNLSSQIVCATAERWLGSPFMQDRARHSDCVRAVKTASEWGPWRCADAYGDTWVFEILTTNRAGMWLSFEWLSVSIESLR